MSHIRTATLLSLAHAGMGARDSRVRNAADSAISYLAFRLREVSINLPPDLDACVQILQEHSRKLVMEE